MNKKNLVLIVVLIVIVFGVSIKVFLSDGVFENEQLELKSYTGVDGCMPAIVNHIAVNDGTIFAQGGNIMYIIDSNRETITHLDINTEEFSRHFYGNDITFAVPEKDEEVVILKWIDRDTAEFDFVSLYPNIMNKYKHSHSGHFETMVKSTLKGGGRRGGRGGQRLGGVGNLYMYSR